MAETDKPQTMAEALTRMRVAVDAFAQSVWRLKVSLGIFVFVVWLALLVAIGIAWATR